MKVSSTKQQHSNLSLTTIIEITSITRIWKREKANPQESVLALERSVNFHRHQYTDSKSSEISDTRVI